MPDGAPSYREWTSFTEDERFVSPHVILPTQLRVALGVVQGERRFFAEIMLTALEDLDRNVGLAIGSRSRYSRNAREIYTDARDWFVHGGAITWPCSCVRICLLFDLDFAAVRAAVLERYPELS